MKFRVGQRVKIVNAKVSKFLIGREGTIVSWVDDARNSGGSTYSGWMLDQRNWCGLPFVAEDGDIVPAYDGAQPIAWDWRAWMENPQGVEV